MTKEEPGTKPSARERILAAAVGQIARDGIESVRIARIAMRAGVSTALVHYHFETRDALLAEALDYSYGHAGDARISSGVLPAGSHAERLQSMIEQCLPTTPSLEQDWVLWVELWLRAARAPDLRPVAEELATHRPRAPELEAVYRDLQTRAHELLHHHPEGTDEDAVLAQASQPAVTWYCDRCGGIDAPQECLDVCVWRPVDWVPEADYRELRERELAEHEVERRLRVLVRRLAWTTPLPGEWARCSDVLAGDARHALAT